MFIYTCKSTIFFFLFVTSCSSLRLGLLFSASLASNSSINSGQSKFSTGSHVLSALKMIIKNEPFMNSNKVFIKYMKYILGKSFPFK